VFHIEAANRTFIKMLVLFETSTGYAIFKLLDEKKLNSTDLLQDFKNPESARKVVEFKRFYQFDDTTEALEATTATIEGKVSASLKKTLKTIFSEEANESLLVADAKLGCAIKEELQIECMHNWNVDVLMRCIRSQADSLIEGLPEQEMALTLGLAHSLYRQKLKYNSNKDVMIVQAVSQLDDYDKHINNCIMRCREWYGLHFPEMGKIVTDNQAFVKTVQLMRIRTNAATTDLSEVLLKEVEEKVKEAAEISIGMEIMEGDIHRILRLCEEVEKTTRCREQLYEHLKSRMKATAPNLTVLVGELVGARLIAHAGSLMNLAKRPSSSVQIFGAEKALFNALRTNPRSTPKYGLIYHAQLVGQSSSTKLKGKMSRWLAAKVALAARVDAFEENVTAELFNPVEHRNNLESRRLNQEVKLSEK